MNNYVDTAFLQGVLLNHEIEDAFHDEFLSAASGRKGGNARTAGTIPSAPAVSLMIMKG